MKKVLLFVFCLSCLTIFSQNVRKSYTFRFNNPETLNPSVTRSPYAGGAVSVTDMLFYSDDNHVSISFVKGASPIGAEIITDNDDGGRIPYLTFNTGVKMIVSVTDPETAQLLEFKTPSYDAIGGLYLQDIDPKGGSAAFERDSSPDVDGIRYYRWQGNAASLTFYNGGQSPSIHQLTVTYLSEALDIFKISEAIPATGNVSSLSDVLLSFPSEVGRVDASKQIKLTDLGGNVITCQASKEGSNSVKIAFNSAVGTGIYSLTIPEGTVIDAAGKYYNPLTTYFYNVGNYEPDVTCSVTPADGSVVDQLSVITLSFTPPANGSVSVANSSLITLSGAGQEIEPVSVTKVSANTFDIRFAGLADGSYTLNVGKGAFAYSLSFGGNAITGDVKNLSYSFTLNQNDKFQTDLMSKFLVYDRDGKSADEAMKDTLLNRFAFYSYDTELGCDPSKTVEIINYNSNQHIRTGHFVATTDPNLPGAYVAELQLDRPITYGSIPSGLYVIIIPEAAIGDKNFKDYLEGKPVAKQDCHVNYQASVYKTVNNSYTPTPDPERPSDAVMAKARAALTKSGIGYPVADAPTRQALQRLVNGGVGTDEDFNKAIQAYYAETSIQLPAVGKWYKIAAVPADDRSRAYVQTNGTLTSDVLKAGAFKIGNGGNSLTFTTIDGQYLTVQPTGVSDVETNLTLARYPVTGDNAEKTFGLITMTNQKDGLMLKVNITTLKITTSGNQAVFTDSETSAIQFTETTEPQADPAPEVEYELSPKGGEVSGKQFTLTLTFMNISDVTADPAKIKLTAGTDVKTAMVTTQDQKAFEIKFGDLTPATYELLMEHGAFAYKYKNRTESVPEIKATYIVPEKSGPSEEMLKKAEAWLAKTGVGFPAASNPARLALQQLLEGKEASDAEFNEAIDRYVAEKSIELPATGKFYRVKISTKPSNGSSINMYVGTKASAQDNSLKMETDAANAAVFLATANDDGTVTLMTLNEKYLSLPQPGECLSLTYDKAHHNLQLPRLDVPGVPAEDTFGQMSISMGGKHAVMFLLGNATYQEPAESPRFEKFYTSAITFEEVDAASIEIPNINLEYTVTPNEDDYTVDVLDKFVLTFHTAKKVTLSDKSKISLIHGINETKMYDVKNVKEVAANTYSISFSHVKSGIYNLIVEEGAFKVSFLGRDVDVQKIVVKGIYAKNDNENNDDGVTGDVNGDGAVNVADISAIIDVMAGYEYWDKEKADINGDDAVNVADISEVINIMAQ